MSLYPALLLVSLVVCGGGEESWWEKYMDRDMSSFFFRAGEDVKPDKEGKPDKEVKLTLCGEQEKPWPLRPRPWTGPAPYGRYADGAQNLLFPTIAKADQVNKSKIYNRKPELADMGFHAGAPYMHMMNLAMNNQLRRYGLRPYYERDGGKN